MFSFWDGSGHIYVMSQPNRPDLWDWRALWLTVRWHPPASISVHHHPPVSATVYPPTSVSCFYPSPPQVKPDLLVDRVSKLNLSSWNASPGPAFQWCHALPWHPTKQGSVCPHCPLEMVIWSYSKRDVGQNSTEGIAYRWITKYILHFFIHIRSNYLPHSG